MPANSGQGWSDLDVPVADLLTPFQKPDTRQRWEPQPDGYIYRAERADQVTGKPVRFSVVFTAAGQHRARACGPERYGVQRVNADGTDLTGWDLINFLPGLIAPATQMREAHAAGPAPPPPPVGTPVGAITPPPAPALASSQHASQPATASAQPAAPVSAQADDSLYSPAYRTCMATSEAADGVTVGILDCVGAETGRQDAQLNGNYRAAMARLAPDQAQVLRISERAWIKRRDAECQTATGDETEGTLGSVIYAQCVLEQEARRVRYIEGLR